MSAPLADTNVPVAEGDVLAGKYRVERVLGQGAMGIVVAAQHIQLQQRVAIKFLTGRATREVKGRFLREAQLAYKLRNEHVARVIDVGELDGGLPFMVMEYLSGQDLQQVLKAEGPMPLAEAIGFVLQVCEAMAEAHSAGIVHRDLKPANLFLTTSSDGSKMVKVLDFGISKETNDPGDSDGGMALTRTEAVLGSPLYMSMEQMRSSRDVDARADIYALGAILYQLLTGRVPFEAQTFPELILKVASEEPPPPSTLRPDIPPPLEQAILRCLKKDRNDRFPNVGEFAAAIAHFATDEGVGSAERALRTIDKSAGGPGSTTLSPAALRATRNSLAGGTRTSTSWSTSTTTGGGVKMKTVGIAVGALVLGAATVMAVIVATSRPSGTAAPPAESSSPGVSATPSGAPPPVQTATTQPSITPLVVPAPYNEPAPSVKPSAKPTASATAVPAGTPPPAATPPPPAVTQQAPPPVTQAPPPATPPPVATPAPTPTVKKNPLDIDIK